MVLRTHGLVVGHDRSPACGPVDVALERGDVLSVVGDNGAGKSTLLRTVLGLLEPVGGRVEVLGRAVDEREAWFRAAVASVLDTEAFIPGVTAREHLLLVARGHATPGPEGVVDDLLDRFGILDAGSRYPASLSSGQRRRLLLAAAFARPRELMVLDEPEQRLDGDMRRALATMIRDEQARGTAVLLATHDPVLLREVGAPVLVVGDRCVVVHAQDAADRLAGDRG
ncbi:ABC transporter ATP-binding protein [Sanguibacter suaedae]|uniref:ABC transporter ATP-binding protein n=1 Tax=Sanguibacter suaedae TaxID=2795737 RepID=A0A934I9F9_9MICO|nr:ABC transporter ATP-binding protein [Sanguibacter suaedae]MBI9115532.1 ABC transporter ATP-binding protein [Sanguibacter suaedae]